MESEMLRVEMAGAVGTIVLDRGDSLNILDHEMLSSLLAGLRTLDAEEAIRAVILTGEKGFSAGADIKRFATMTPRQAEDFARLGQEVCDFIEAMGKAVIVAIGGHALGGACEIALACDIRIAAEGSRIGLPELRLGIIPGFGGTQRLLRVVGFGRAKEMIFTGRVVGAAEAVAIGLVNKLVKDEDLLKEASAMAEEIASRSPLTIRSAKALINQVGTFAEGLEKEIAAFSACFFTEDCREGVQAFLQKRKPAFRGR